ncbi:MAG: beta-hexosaminidase precursor [Acidimicrobiales bacterium]|nr:beta-hexosaminidase precursor [Acidimicrobiales bacterium]
MPAPDPSVPGPAVPRPRPGPLDGVVPQPVEVRPGAGELVLSEATVLVLDAGSPASDAAELLRRSLEPVVGTALPVRSAPDPAGTAVVFTDIGTAGDLEPEGYRLRIGPDGVEVSAGDHDGFVWAVQTLRQLLPTARAGRDPGPNGCALPCGEIRDAPRYAWRGAMLDVARHFFGPDDVRSVVELLSTYKLNRLHLHLTDDQGWRIHIDAHPELAAIGGRTAVGGGTGGSFTQDQLADIVDHATRLGVTVVPEIDVPGHTNAALTALGWLSCDGEVRLPYTEIGVGFSSVCVDDERTYRWLDDVIGEVAALTSGRWIHIGGDESKATDTDGYQRFIRRALDIVRAHGKVPVGWEEVGTAPLGGPAVVQHWFDRAPALAAAAQGAELIMSPAGRTYMDQKYDPSTPIGLGWMCDITSRRAYEWDPDARIRELDPSRVIGIEAPLWTETVTTRADIERMLLPRLPALAEVGWTPQDLRAWPSFERRIAAHQPRWEAAGWAWTADPAVAGLTGAAAGLSGAGPGL